MPSAVLSLLLAGAVLAPLVENNQIGPGWRVVTLPRQTKPVTRFVPEVAAERQALRIDADHSYGALVFDLPAAQPAPRLLQWQWRIEQPNSAADLHARSGDDTPAKVCLSFDLPIDNLGFGDRQLLRLMRSSSDEPVPAATLCWVWGAAEPHGALIENAFTRRVRYIVLRNGSDASATWFDESRDIAADFKRAFGDESATLPPLLGVVVGGDADNTAAHSVAHLRALRFAEP
jgi:hypothetical protein